MIGHACWAEKIRTQKWTSHRKCKCQGAKIPPKWLIRNKKWCWKIRKYLRKSYQGESFATPAHSIAREVNLRWHSAARLLGQLAWHQACRGCPWLIRVQVKFALLVRSLLVPALTQLCKGMWAGRAGSGCGTGGFLPSWNLPRIGGCLLVLGITYQVKRFSSRVNFQKVLASWSLEFCWKPKCQQVSEIPSVTLFPVNPACPRSQPSWVKQGVRQITTNDKITITPF